MKPYIYIFGLLAFLLMSCVSSAYAQPCNADTVQGQVRDANRQPIKNATITLVDKLTNRTDVAKSDNEGLYKFRQGMPGDYQITTEAEGFIPRTAFVFLLCGVFDPDFDFVLNKTTDKHITNIIGKVANTYGTGVSQIEVTLLDLNNHAYQLVTNEEGMYQFEDLPPGIYRLELLARKAEYPNTFGCNLDLTIENVTYFVYWQAGKTAP